MLFRSVQHIQRHAAVAEQVALLQQLQRALHVVVQPAQQDDAQVVQLAIDALGSPELTVHRAGKPLKSIPPASAKTPEIAGLRDRATSLRKQIRRMRSSLESACVLGDAFEPREIADLLRHPILAPMLRDLVLVDSAGALGLPEIGRAHV